MCGIYGTTMPVGDETVLAKLARARFRGPDVSGFERSEGVVLGHNRLAIIDIDPRSNQPFSYGYLKIVFNGEIYNYRELRKTLIDLGHHFHTTCDTEVICAAYMEYGANCVDHFNGMFAFVIHDMRKGLLFGARDRLGKKPLYYYKGEGFEFASQPSQISMDKELSINPDAVSAYLHWSYIPDQYCIFKGIEKLKAGHCFTYNLHKGILVERKYWDMDQQSTGIYSKSYAEAKEELGLLIQDAVRIRLHADVPLGIFLSGGIDSSLVASLAAKENALTKTFCIRFEDKNLDESIHAEKIAHYLGTEHQTITCLHSDGLDMLQNYGCFFDEPFADPSAIPLMLLAKHTKKHVTVALSGDGGDEGFLGYGRYDWMKKAGWAYQLPLSMRSTLFSLAKLSPNYRHRLIGAGLVQKDLASLYEGLCTGMDTSWLSEKHYQTDQPHRWLLEQDQQPLMQRLSNYDIKTYLCDDINTKVDRATMAYALEARAPLMDYRVMEFANQLPVHYKMGGRFGKKRIIKDLLFDRLPEDFFKRPKAGFTLPIKSWLQNELKEYVLDHLSLSSLSDIPGLVPTKVKKMIDLHLAGKHNYSSQIWSVLMLKRWLDSNKLTHKKILVNQE
ncbi:asparagine synthase (glutamine-hydrolyzing) [Pedobacter roseus]|uniref:asparagine synthase (glutamine-hydrolyzing) n=1 Tax=Pedobacter roseus TaxID=336820 RepID=A0A7G9QLQ4_9SPHI|nr:asparagine synthase (glutamine-hydrolyzing) [Pedobacter roseus]QNN44279.1 asparagine synthase (glutamine-hydrolyzing) [Pedobacter roseus]